MDTQNSLNTTTENQNNSSQNELVQLLLKDHVLNIVFIKADGSERKMKCTLRPDLLPASDSINESVENPDVCRVYDLENEGWRSFRYERLVSIDVVTA